MFHNPMLNIYFSVLISTKCCDDADVGPRDDPILLYRLPLVFKEVVVMLTSAPKEEKELLGCLETGLYQ